MVAGAAAGAAPAHVPSLVSQQTALHSVIKINTKKQSCVWAGRKGRQRLYLKKRPLVFPLLFYKCI